MKKSKWDIIGKEIDKDINSEYDSWFYWWYDGEDYFDHDYGQYYTYDYSEPVYREYFSKRGKWGKDKHLLGNYIDMMSIYSPQVLRQKKIDYLLGIDKWEVTSKPTILDYINYKKGNERN
jgi:hypothetical protein